MHYDEYAKGSSVADSPRLEVALCIVMIQYGDSGRVDQSNCDRNLYGEQIVVHLRRNRKRV